MAPEVVHVWILIAIRSQNPWPGKFLSIVKHAVVIAYNCWEYTYHDRFSLEVYVVRFTAANIQFHQRSPSLPPHRTDGSPPALSLQVVLTQHISECSSRWETEMKILYLSPNLLLWLSAQPRCFRDLKLTLLLENRCKQGNSELQRPVLSVAGFLSL